jgi:hypothetical protein
MKHLKKPMMRAKPLGFVVASHNWFCWEPSLLLVCFNDPSKQGHPIVSSAFSFIFGRLKCHHKYQRMLCSWMLFSTSNMYFLLDSTRGKHLGSIFEPSHHNGNTPSLASISHFSALSLGAISIR